MQPPQLLRLSRRTRPGSSRPASDGERAGPTGGLNRRRRRSRGVRDFADSRASRGSGTMTTRIRTGVRRRATVALATVVPLLVMGPGQTATPSAATASAAAVGPVTNGMIATFAWQPDAHISEELDLVVMKPDGSGAQVLVSAAAKRSLCGFDLDWSPDGNRIAWASGGQVWTIKADGTDRQHLADGCVSHLDWSPDGGTLAVEIEGRTGLLSLPGAPSPGCAAASTARAAPASRPTARGSAPSRPRTATATRSGGASTASTSRTGRWTPATRTRTCEASHRTTCWTPSPTVPSGTRART